MPKLPMIQNLSFIASLKKWIISLFFIGLSLSLSSCSYIEPYKPGVTQGNILTKENVDLLQKGLTHGQVRQLLGPPMGANPFNPYHWEYLYYSTAVEKRDSEVNQQLIIEFDSNHLLSAWELQPLKVELKEEDKFLGLF